MPTGPINGKGGFVLFSDTGEVRGVQDYTTLIIVHGTSFNSGTFSRLPPIASAHNMRTVLLTRRDYRGSSPYTAEDLEALNGGKKEFLQGLGQELAYFLIWFIENNNIPQTSCGGKRGGIALMGWSMGNHVTLSLLGQPDAIQAESYNHLSSYVRHFILYDPPFTSLGYPIPTNGYHPFRDPDFETIEQKVMNFGVWVSEYYKHPGYDARDLFNLDFRKHGDDPSVKHLTSSEREWIVEKEPVGRVDQPLVFKMQKELGLQSGRALFNPHYAKQVLPNLPVTFLACKSTNWYCVYSFFETERRFKEAEAQARPIQFIELPYANHFVHWDNPEQLMDVTRSVLQV